jgi:hypothetical protein
VPVVARNASREPRPLARLGGGSADRLLDPRAGVRAFAAGLPDVLAGLSAFAAGLLDLRARMRVIYRLVY